MIDGSGYSAYPQGTKSVIHMKPGYGYTFFDSIFWGDTHGFQQKTGHNTCKYVAGFMSKSIIVDVWKNRQEYDFLNITKQGVIIPKYYNWTDAYNWETHEILKDEEKKVRAADLARVKKKAKKKRKRKATWTHRKNKHKKLKNKGRKLRRKRGGGGVKHD